MITNCEHFKQMFTVAPFSKKSIVLGPFMSQKTIGMICFTVYWDLKFFFAVESMYFLLHSLKTNICFRFKWFLQQTNSKKCSVYIQGKKKGLKKIILYFFQKHPLCIVWPTYFIVNVLIVILLINFTIILNIILNRSICTHTIYILLSTDRRFPWIITLQCG